MWPTVTGVRVYEAPLPFFFFMWGVGTGTEAFRSIMAATGSSMCLDSLQDAPPAGLTALAIPDVHLCHALALQGWPYAMRSIAQLIMLCWKAHASRTPSARLL